MLIPRQYTDYDLVTIYTLIVTQDRVGIENSYPELVGYIYELYHALNFDFRKYVSNSYSRNKIIEWVSGMIKFINITNNKEFIINRDVIDMIGNPDYFDFPDYVFRYISLFYPDDMVNYNINVYISQMYNVLRYIINTDINPENVLYDKIINNTFSKNPTLMKLLRVLKDIRINHYDTLKNGHYRFELLLIVSYCYYKKADYKILYNYITDPNKYIDKLILNGYTFLTDYDLLEWYKGKKEQIFLDANEFFQENDVIIK